MIQSINTIKLKPVDLKSETYFDSGKKKLIINILNLKLVMLVEYQNMKTFLQKVTLRIDQKNVL